MIVDPETFGTLLKNPAHWEFEVFLMFLQDVVLGLLILPLVRRHWNRYHPKWATKPGEVTTTEGHVWVNGGKYFNREVAEQVRDIGGLPADQMDVYQGMSK